MNKTFKITLCVGLCALIVGIVVCVACLIASNFHIASLSAAKAEMQTFTESAENVITEIDVDYHNAQISVEVADTLSVEYPQLQDQNGNNLATVTCEETSGTFSVSEQSHTNFSLGMQFITPKVTLRLPSNRTYTLRLQTKNGAISVYGTNWQFARLEASTKNGNVQLLAKNVAVEQAALLETSNGKITLSALAAQSITAETKNGAIEAKGNLIANEKIWLDSKNGSIGASGTLQAKSVTAETKNGQISLPKAITADEIILESKIGNVTAVIDGAISEYTVTVEKPATGTSNIVSQTGGTKTLRVSTSTGNIGIDFTE